MIKARNVESLEEFLHEQAGVKRRLDAQIVPQQREIVWGSYCVRPNNDGVLIYTEVTTLEQYREDLLQNAINQREIDVELAQLEDSYSQNYRHGRHYSVHSPDGEFGVIHIATSWPISQEEFEAAKANDWRPQIQLINRLREEIRGVLEGRQ